MLALALFARHAHTATTTINTAGNQVETLGADDTLHLDIPASHDAYVVTSESIKEIKVDSTTLSVKSSDKVIAVKIVGTTADITISKKWKANVWIIPSTMCPSGSMFVYGTQFSIYGKDLKASSSSCIFPTYSTGAAVMSVKPVKSTATVYKDLSTTKVCAKDTETILAVENPPIIELDKDISALSIILKTINEETFNSVKNGVFATVTKDGKTAGSFPHDITVNENTSFLDYIKNDDNGWIVALVLGIVGIIALVGVIALLCYCFFKAGKCCCNVFKPKVGADDQDEANDCDNKDENKIVGNEEEKKDDDDQKVQYPAPQNAYALDVNQQQNIYQQPVYEP